MPDHGRSGATSAGSLRHGIQEGVNNMDNKRVVADSSRCIGCQTCMAACIEAHDIPGNIAAPRLRVTRTYEISAPVACHHCEDAPCAKACPTGALFFDPKNHRIGVNEDNCIGCKSCVMACPFGAVSVATTQVPVLMGDVRVGSQTKELRAQVRPVRGPSRRSGVCRGVPDQGPHLGRRGAPGRTDCRACPRHHRKRGVAGRPYRPNDCQIRTD